MKAFGPVKILIFAAFTSVFAAFTANSFDFSVEKAVDNDNVNDLVEILAFGDSLTAGYGLHAGDGFTGQLEVWLNENSDKTIKVINGGVSGDTTSGGRSRLDWALSPIKNGRPDLVILTLGGNDALRGVAPDITRDNVDAMVKSLAEKEIPVLIGGMLATPSWGLEYGAAFDSIFPDVAQKYNVPLYPFFLDGVAAITELNQGDGLHPNKEGVAVIVGKIGPVILDLVSN